MNKVQEHQFSSVNFYTKENKNNISPSISAAEIYVGIEGPIGVGKTTLAGLLQEKWGADVIYEKFEENPFLPYFYTRREHYALHTQLFFLFNRYFQLRHMKPRNQPLVSDYIFSKDRLFAEINLSGNELKIYQGLYMTLEEQVLKPNLVIYLQASVDVLINRIKTRGRSFEQNIDRMYIEHVAKAYDGFFIKYDAAPVIKIDTTRINIITNSKDKRGIIERIEQTFTNLISKSQFRKV